MNTTHRIVVLFAVIGVLPGALSIPAVSLLANGMDAIADRRIAMGMLGITTTLLIPCAVTGLVAAAISSRVRSDGGWIAVCGAVGFVTTAALLFVTPIYAIFLQGSLVAVVVTGVISAVGAVLAALCARSLRRRPPSIVG